VRAFSIAAVIASGGVYAMYGASRSIALVLVIAAVLIFRSPVGVTAMALTMALVQIFDAGIGVLSHDAMKTIGPLVLAVATLLSLLPLLRGIRDSSIRGNG
jgi:hypothetical protein